ncbi:uncharacterized protein LOC129746913 [Uranotaenia lowii]|uniref:uncharacterized protein LOC129746913 n=1 Tax=Uranotaenia lowii TaxID=190385 RepID=UPI00247928E5|nr:uncharacterized protein LOC129746913 [Uranotaenia lowii]
MLSGAEFILSSAGISKLISLICMIVGGLIFIVAGDCTDSSFWSMFYISSTTISALLSFFSYTMYALNLIKSDEGLKVQNMVEITFAYIVFLVLLIASILMTTSCNKKYAIDFVPEPLTIIGAILLAIGATLLFLDWRSGDNAEHLQMSFAEPVRPQPNHHTINPTTYRKSILV